MDVKKVRELRQELEEEILMLVDDFEKKSECDVADIILERIDARTFDSETGRRPSILNKIVIRLVL